MSPEILSIISNLGPWGFAVAVAWILLRFVLNHMTHKLDDIHETLREFVNEMRLWMQRHG